MERRTFLYDGEKFEERELVLINGKELMYCRFVDSWMGKDAMYAVFAPRYKQVYRYEPVGENVYATYHMRAVHNGDKIEHVYDPEPYNEHLIKRDEPITNGYLIDGWIICIILMFVTMMFKPVGAWSLTILGVWLMLRHEERERIKSMKK